MNANADHDRVGASASRLPTTRKVGHPSRWKTVAVLLTILLAVLVIVAAINHMGIRITGNALAWREWMRNHAVHFFVWRLCLYGVIASGWVWMRRRKLERLPSEEVRQQMLRTEIGIVAFLTILEIQKWLLRS